MAAHRVWALLALAVVGRADAGTPGRLVEEAWEEARVGGEHVGFVHVRVWETDSPAGRRLRTSAEMDLTLRRHGSPVRLFTEQGTEETTEGRVVGVFLRHGPEGARRLVLDGAMQDGRMHVRVDGGRIDRLLSWPEGVVGWYAREHLFAKRRPAPGDRFAFPRYEPTFNTVVTTRVRVVGLEDVDLPGVRRKLLRVEMTADPLETRSGRVQPPGCVWWLDDSFRPVRRTEELEGLGELVLTRTERSEATAPPAPGRGADIGLRTLVPLDRAVPRPYATRVAVYRVTLRGDPEPATAFARDAHQDVRVLDGQTIELHVHPPAGPPAGSLPPAAPGPEYLAPCVWIDCDDSRVAALAARVVGDEKHPWSRARRVERWVKQNLRVDNAAPLAPASEAARTLRGDCRHCALLTAALCRAAGVPARTAVGLLYVERGGRPQMGFHMWTEVWVGGRWLGLDGTLGRGGVDAAHVKVADHSWHDVRSLTPLLPVARVLGKMSIEVVSAGEQR
jgi:transglutaminase-like putative cysteine protease